ncbi:sugar-binding transcriptional regulator [Irregularibacter muris]|uniref:Sugar-binding transcriptional regulator n=1 Tax=Irregularibacter muris TaxID=1796619 RepID=A0AAE3KYU0_9FIRM|nr:sugar-binding transcriptional regulator [Irregularibacter muris]MCR1897556.1 sugar-binding transcriptional regulator [Irregularibacter muris]
MKNYRNIRLMVKCSKMYYEENMNQIEIGKKLGVSKATISRILTSARKEGIVKISVVNPLSHENLEIEKELEKLFGLQEVVVVQVASNDIEDIKKSIAREAAYILERILKPQMLIGVGNGSTLEKVSQYVENYKSNDFTFVPMVGGNGQINANIQSNNIAQSFAKSFKAHYKILHAPAMVKSLEIKESFIQDSGIRSILNLTEKLDVGIVGIGSSDLETTVRILTEYISQEELLDLRKKGAVADICNKFMDSQGKGDFEVNENVIGIDLEDLIKIPCVIGVAGHSKKSDAIISAIKSGLINILVTDYDTANIILKKRKEEIYG